MKHAITSARQVCPYHWSCHEYRQLCRFGPRIHTRWARAPRISEIGSQLPLEYIQTVPHHDKIDALWACLIVYQLTSCTIVPCVFQLQVVLATLNGWDTIITAGTRSGKTLCQLIPMLLLLWFYSWVALFSLSLLFMLRLLSWDPFVTLTITISLSWDPSPSPYAPFNPVHRSLHYYWTGGTLCLSFLSHGWLLLQPILLYLLCIPLTHPSFYNVPWPSILTQRNILLSSVMFFRLLSRSPLEYISPHTCTYSTLLICAIHASHLLSLAPRPDPPSPLVTLCHTRAHQALDYLYKSMSYFEGLSTRSSLAYLYKSMSYFEGLFALFPWPPVTLT